MKAHVFIGIITVIALVCGCTREAWAEVVRDDVTWEQRRERYDGGPLRPGWQIHGSINSKVWIGLGAFAAGYIAGGAFSKQALGWIPFAGPWAAIASPPSENENEGGYTTATYVFLAISGLAQAVGAGLAIWGILDPNLFVIYDAPVGSPPLRATLQPGTSESNLGLSFTLRWLS